MKARGKHEEKQDMKKLRCGTTGVGENGLTLGASVLYFCILRVRNKLNKKKLSVEETENTNVAVFFS